MKELFSGDIALVSLMQLALKQAGIDCMATDCVDWHDSYNDHPVPTLWVQDSDFTRALAFIAETKKNASQTWTCGKCGERVPATFGVCWNCGQPAS